MKIPLKLILIAPSGALYLLMLANKDLSIFISHQANATVSQWSLATTLSSMQLTQRTQLMNQTNPLIIIEEALNTYISLDVLTH